MVVASGVNVAVRFPQSSVRDQDAVTEVVSAARSSQPSAERPRFWQLRARGPSAGWPRTRRLRVVAAEVAAAKVGADWYGPWIVARPFLSNLRFSFFSLPLSLFFSILFFSSDKAARGRERSRRE